MKYPSSGFIFGAILSAATIAHATDSAVTAGNPIGRFEISRFEVEGNTLLKPDAMRELLAPYAGKSRDFGHVQRALEALEAAYHQHGYKLVQVVLPEQELNQGVVRLRVVETRIGNVKVEGNKFFDAANIRRSLPGLREGEVPAIDDVSASLRMANESPAKKTTLNLQGSEQEGLVNAVLKVKDEKPWTVGMNVDNAGQPATGSHNIGVSFQHANVAGLDHILSLQYQTTIEKPNQVSVYGVGYHIPLYGLGDSIDLFGSYSDVNSGTVAAGLVNLNISGRGTVLGARYNQTLARRSEHDAKLIYGIDYKAFESDVQIPGVPLQLGSDVTVRPLSLSYAGTWTPASSAINYYVSAIHNLGGGENGSSQDFNLARFGASPWYKMLRLGGSVNRAFASDWQVRLMFNGQLTADALVPGEQFGAGGASSVRGYREREIINDMGFYAGAEIYTPNLCAKLASNGAQCRALAFIDGARLIRNKALPGELARSDISSIGVGMRVIVQRNLAMQLDLGHAMASAGTTSAGDNRLHFKMNLAY
ncbi:hemolysin activation/secretion protein [Paucimonas lemoignei]|uniref:Hemolysin activation/secretion protein n=1 Tax=Paucimonas lemoignei TaxID=29443 RepID=A0A4R3I0B6_PAULE|nr:ShlB/FhaC/HecB family hemolysin secretion/activation protein [Paucimonas lemoignei]TCS39126.1 hemolysin activation/secretion protein [Paucimonas lemoignei]